MENLNFLYGLIFLIVLISAGATVAVGVSQKNKEGNPKYDQRSAKNLIRLTVIYGITIIGGYLVFALFYA
ncbi:hypothetical protein FPZ49_28090 [Paenibacillus cremeus]|uniref:Uncharacterized protein n=2 Tax=Paenibacillus cremeus TaxID=2163881 RepID=A0A559K3K0_9BACL|nr:hypothetical protein FPZ49_28090 [Paenibacillus cremeus]